MKIGDKVTLEPGCKKAQIEPERYEIGTVAYIGSWKCVGVKWNGFDKVIIMRQDELELVEE